MSGLARGMWHGFSVLGFGLIKKAEAEFRVHTPSSKPRAPPLHLASLPGSQLGDSQEAQLVAGSPGGQRELCRVVQSATARTTQQCGQWLGQLNSVPKPHGRCSEPRIPSLGFARAAAASAYSRNWGSHGGKHEHLNWSSFPSKHPSAGNTVLWPQGPCSAGKDQVALQVGAYPAHHFGNVALVKF